MKKKSKKTKRKRKLSTYYRAPYKTGTIQLRVNKDTYDTLAKQAEKAGVYLPAYTRYLLEKIVLGLGRPGIISDEWVWAKLIPHYWEQEGREKPMSIYSGDYIVDGGGRAYDEARRSK